MKDIFVKDIIKYCNGTLLMGDAETPLKNFSKDTRTIKKGDIYLGLKGDNFDGNTLYEEALSKGAVGCILNKNIDLKKDIRDKYQDQFIVLVDDTLSILQELAKLKRNLVDIPVVAITGSVGKTSTKDMVASVLAQKYKVLKTEGNLNNHIGLPLTILNYKDEDVMVLEMGMNNLGEISCLSHIAKPTLSIITNIGTAHIGNLGSRENILKAKLEILEGMAEKKVIINNDNDLLSNWGKDNQDKIVTYGIETPSMFEAKDITLDDKGSTFIINYPEGSVEIRVNVPGAPFILNSLCAFGVGYLFNLDISDIKKGIANFELSKERMEIEEFVNFKIIKDYYNANYDSMVSALNYLGVTKAKRKISILGDMLELGEYSEELHHKVGKSVLENNVDVLITIGKLSKYINDECLKLGMNESNVYHFSNNEDAFNFLKDFIQEDDIILLKASHGMNFNNLYEKIKGYFQS